jgi:hypothetical protein
MTEAPDDRLALPARLCQGDPLARPLSDGSRAWQGARPSTASGINERPHRLS